MRTWSHHAYPMLWFDGILSYTQIIKLRSTKWLMILVDHTRRQTNRTLRTMRNCTMYSFRNSRNRIFQDHGRQQHVAELEQRTHRRTRPLVCPTRLRLQESLQASQFAVCVWVSTRCDADSVRCMRRAAAAALPCRALVFPVPLLAADAALTVRHEGLEACLPFLLALPRS